MRLARLAVPAMFLGLLLSVGGGGGCAKYEYNLVRPPELTRHIGSGVDAVVTIEPLEYRMITVDNRLVVRIFNHAEEPIELIGPRSAVVDPNGQSHPIREQVIPPGAFVKFILPPERPRVYEPYYGPTWGVGFGAYHRVDARPYPHYYEGWPYWHTFPAYYRYGYPGPYFYPPDFYSPYADDYGPRYLVIVEENDTYYWEWKDEGECRLILVYSRAGKEFTHDFLFRRQKM